jgi:hypothetical protein
MLFTWISGFDSNADLPALLSKLIPIVRSKAPSQILSSAHNKISHPNVVPFHFLPPIVYQYLPEDERALPGNLQSRKIFLPPPLHVVPLTSSSPTLSALSLFLSPCFRGLHFVDMSDRLLPFDVKIKRQNGSNREFSGYRLKVVDTNKWFVSVGIS